MAKHANLYVCTECGWAAPKWLGQCRECQAWGTLEESGEGGGLDRRSLSRTRERPARPAQRIDQIDLDGARATSTGISELDRVLGGGLVAGSVVLLAGEPGVGKSTLLVEVAARVAELSQGSVLYLTGEESAAQVRLRAERVGAISPGLYLAAENDLAQVAAQVKAVNPGLLIVDSVQTFTDSSLDGQAGGVGQVRAVSAGLIAIAKERAMPVVLVGHVTKDGAIAGPRVLEHLVDVVCYFEGDRHSPLRLARAVKNRYGPTDEVGCFEMREDGLVELPDPSGLFLSYSPTQVPGTCVTVTLEGRRPMPIEVQALVAASSGGSPRRATSGVDSSRTAMSLAVLAARAGLDFTALDVYVSTVGGARVGEPAGDLALALAIASAGSGRELRGRLVAMGEVSLTGELRPMTGLARRLSEAARLGFSVAIVPAAGAADLPRISGLEIIPVLNLADAIMLSRAPD